MNSITNLTPQQLRNAAEIQEQILSLQQELSQILGSEATPPTDTETRRRQISPEGLERIRAAQRRRWAVAGSINSKKQRTDKPKRTMSAAGRARIAAALRARWRAAKRAGRSVL